MSDDLTNPRAERAARQTPDTRELREALTRIIESWEATIKVIDMPAPLYRTSVLDAMAVWPKGANGPIAISAYEALVERLREHRAVVSASRAALAAEPARPGLDVEALARALEPFTRAVLHDDIGKWRRETAAKIVTEYARLTEDRP